MDLHRLAKLFALTVTFALAGCAGETGDDSADGEEEEEVGTSDSAYSKVGHCRASDGGRKFEFNVTSVKSNGVVTVVVKGDPKRSKGDLRWTEQRSSWNGKKLVWKHLNTFGGGILGFGKYAVWGETGNIGNSTRTLTIAKPLKSGDRVMFEMIFDDAGSDPRCKTEWVAVQ